MAYCTDSSVSRVFRWAQAMGKAWQGTAARACDDYLVARMVATLWSGEVWKFR